MKTQIVKSAYEVLQSKRKKLKRNAIFFASFLLIVNVYAWFVFVANANLSINANIVGWDIKFYDENAVLMDFDIVVDDLRPGMNTFTKKILIKNSGETVSDFTFKVNQLSILGSDIVIEDTTVGNEKVLNSLEKDYPFKISHTANKKVLQHKGDQIEFTITVSWPFEQTNQYYKLTNDFIYNPKLSYYTLTDTYHLALDITSANINEKIRTGLYIESDDGDSFWGEQAAKYKENNPTLSSLRYHLDLKVSQRGTTTP
ncbi:MAG: hypothetical protein RR161_01185 [Bacilli bacterium]